MGAENELASFIIEIATRTLCGREQEKSVKVELEHHERGDERSLEAKSWLGEGETEKCVLVLY
jgi:hypothetical protein